MTMAPALTTGNRAFYLEGRQVMLFSGALHYFRVVPEYWEDRMKRLQACGLNTVETYVPWNWHEEVRGTFNFEGLLDIRRFILTAHSLGMYVILRPGPYICAEWDFGGLPSWLLSDPKMEVRSPYKPYLDAVDRYFSKLIPLVSDLQCSRGGPIIAVQIENEYGSYGDDLTYKMFLKKTLERYGITELLFTSDNGMGIQRGEVPGTLITANYQEQHHGYLMYEYLKNHKQPSQPLMVMEFWTGWFDHWGGKHEIWPTEKFEEVLTWILDQESSVNFYMMHGGTNYGFMAGANEDLGATNEGGGETYAPDVTSYDYDAPISENGDLSPKFYKIKELLQTKCRPFVPETLPLPPSPIPSKAYGEVKVNGYLTFEDILTFVKPITSEKPVTMEMLDINNGGGQSFGFTLYRKSKLGQGQQLTFNGKVKDRAVVLLNNQEIGTVHWTTENCKMNLPTSGSQEGSTLDVLVENCGRVNYADYRSPILNQQRKGLTDSVLLDKTAISNWEIYPLEFKKDFIQKASQSGAWRSGVPARGSPCLCRLELNIPDKPDDTYIVLKGWTKGSVFVNGFNLGRYWDIGPQETLYIPGPLLKQGANQLVIFEVHRPGTSVTFTARPQLGEEVVHTTVIPDVEFEK